ncbi:MAG: MMPL family transporter [Proteobacteria bacterium]|nr:MMPL family transporter [Pseudomonadota bacterium]MBU1419452.1 MMPL family transporter [Pseudomonadota bacterium]MBU1454034.1 MMPL family transporter [Pseudomonadota bacterium]
MKTLKKFCEITFGKIARWSFRHHWLAIIFVLTIFTALISQIPSLTTDMSNEGFFRPDDKVLVDYNEFRNQFGKDEFIVVSIRGADVFNLDFLKRLRDLHHDLENEVSFLDEVTSLVNIRNTWGQGDELFVEDFLERWPENGDDLNELKKRAGENTLYENFILNKEGTVTAVIIKPLACNPDSKVLLQVEGTCQPMTNVQNREMVTTIEKILKRYDGEDFSVLMSGMPAVIESLNITLEKDLAIIIPMIFLMVSIFLGLLFRRISGVVYPVLIFTFSLLSAIGIMAALGIPMTGITTILPSFILVVSISDSVHILALFYPAFQKTGDRETAIVAAMEHSGLPVLMTSVTTAAGLASFASAKVAPVADLGIVTPIGVFLALLYTVFLLPALLALFPVKKKESVQRRERIFETIFDKIAAISCEKQWWVIGSFTVLLLVAIAGVTQLRFEHNALKWFPKDSKIRLATEEIDREMRGTVSFDVVIDTGKADGLYDPDFIRSLEEAALKFGNYKTEDLFVGKVLALTTVLKETNRALHDNNQDYYSIPDNSELIAQELFLFQLSGSDDLEELVDQQFSKTRFTMHVPYRDTSRYKKFVSDVRSDLVERFPECDIVTTGVNAIFVEILNNVMTSMTRSYTIALVLISGLMILMLGKIRMGLLSMIPNLFPIVLIMGLMGWCGIPLDFGTILIGSITLGLVVDDTIHFLHNFARYYDEYGDPKKATQKTLNTVGRAMLVTSLVLAGGFLCDLFSELTLNKYSGFLIASTILAALITDYFLAPAILSLVYKKKQLQQS